MPRLFQLSFAALISIAIAGCSGGLFGGRKIDYRTAGQPGGPGLEVPPDLTKPQGDDRFAIPERSSSSATSYSSYTRERGEAPKSTASSGILPTSTKARIERSGTQRWLVVNLPVDKVWVEVRDFWREQGFVLRVENPQTGVMETEFAENRAKIPDDVIRRTVGRVFEGMWSTSERDKFRTRLERGADPNTTEIYLSHRGYQEIYKNEYKDQTIWQPRPVDPDLEAEFLSRMLTKLGADDKLMTAQPGTGAAAGTSAQAQRIQLAGDKLTVLEPFDRAWRRVGLSLDRTGFRVEDRDRSKGLYYVRFADPDSELNKSKPKGWLDRLAFWRSDEKKLAEIQYRVRLAETSGNTLVEVQDAQGAPEKTQTAEKILKLLADDLK